jgi:hypothetical protein
VLVMTGAVAGGGVAGAATSGTLTATLSGKNELKQGAANGKGTFSATWQGSKLCYTLKYSGLTKPAAAHIHKGTAKQDGSIVVDLKPTFKSGKASNCVTVASKLASAIKKSPSGYYANVHTQAYPAGAIRGQLSSH